MKNETSNNRQKNLLLGFLMLAALGLMGCNNGNKDSSAGQPPPADPRGSAGAQSAGTTGGSCGVETATLTAVSSNGVCDFLEGSETECTRNFDRNNAQMSISGRVFLRPVRVGGTVNDIQVLPSRNSSTALADTSYLTLTFKDGRGTSYVIQYLKLSAATTNIFKGGNVDMNFADEFGAIRLVGTHTDGTNGQTEVQVCGVSYKGSNSSYATSNGCPSGYSFIGRLSIKTCKLVLPVEQ